MKKISDTDAIADEIEREIAEKYMELPVDADGEPIHMGDAMYDGKVAKLVISDDGEHSVYVYKLPNVLHEIYCYETAHVKPRTMRDILFDFMRDCETSELGNSELVEKYEAELRDLLGGDAE